MGHCRTVGKVRETSRHELGVDLEWKIPEFFSLPDSSDCIFYSPDFSHDGASWYLIVYPNGQAYCATQGWIVLFLCRRLCSPQKAARFGLGIRKANGAREDFLGDLRLPEGCTHLRINEFLLRSELLKRKCQLAPSNSLTVTCTMYRDFTSCVQDNILTNSDEQKPTSVQFKFSERMDMNTEADNTLESSEEHKPSSVQIKFFEQMDKNGKIGKHDNIQKIPVKEVSDNTSKKKENCDKGVASVRRAVKRAVRCILKYFGDCVGRH